MSDCSIADDTEIASLPLNVDPDVFEDFLSEECADGVVNIDAMKTALGDDLDDDDMQVISGIITGRGYTIQEAASPQPTRSRRIRRNALSTDDDLALGKQIDDTIFDILTCLIAIPQGREMMEKSIHDALSDAKRISEDFDITRSTGGDDSDVEVEVEAVDDTQRHREFVDTALKTAQEISDALSKPCPDLDKAARLFHTSLRPRLSTLSHFVETVIKQHDRYMAVRMRILKIADQMKCDRKEFLSHFLSHDEQYFLDHGLRDGGVSESVRHLIETCREDINQIESVVGDIPTFHAKVSDLKKADMTNKAAREALAGMYERLVGSIASRRVSTAGMEYEDLLQEGTIGLMKAVEKFDYSKGHRFSTYATWWIRQAITRAILDQASTIRIPVHMVETIQQVKKAQSILKKQNNGAAPSSIEIAAYMGITVPKVRSILRIVQEPMSLDAPMGNEADSSTLGELVPDTKGRSPLTTALTGDVQVNITKALDRLHPRSEEIVRYRYSLGCLAHVDLTLEHVGQLFNLTRERIRQVEKRALQDINESAAPLEDLCEET